MIEVDDDRLAFAAAVVNSCTREVANVCLAAGLSPDRVELADLLLPVVLDLVTNGQRGERRPERLN